MALVNWSLSLSSSVVTGQPWPKLEGRLRGRYEFGHSVDHHRSVNHMAWGLKNHPLCQNSKVSLTDLLGRVGIELPGQK